MSRQRFIYPEFFSSEDLGRLPRDARLLFAGMFTLADDYGRGKASAEVLRSSVFPYDTDLSIEDVEKLLHAVSARKLVRIYESDFSTYYEITKWDKHQQPKYKAKPKVPPPPRNSPIRPESGTNPGRVRPESGENPETGIDWGSGLGLGREGFRRGGNASNSSDGAKLDANDLPPVSNPDPEPGPDQETHPEPGPERAEILEGREAYADGLEALKQILRGTNA